jgi:hypothetical protein
MSEMINAYISLIGKPKGKVQHGRPRSRKVDSIKQALEEIGWISVECIYLAHDSESCGHFCEDNEPFVFMKVENFLIR